MKSLDDYIPKIPMGLDDNVIDVEDNISYEIVNALSELHCTTSDLLQTESELVLRYISDEYGISFENVDADIGIQIGIKPSRDPHTGTPNVLDVKINSRVGFFESLAKKMRDLALRVATAIRNFFVSIHHFFQSKISKVDNMLLHANFSIVDKYYSDTSKSCKIKLTKYMINDPIAEYKKDQDVLRLAVPRLKDAIITLVDHIENPITLQEKTGSKSDMYVTYQRDRDEIQTLFDEIFGKLAGPHVNLEMIHEMNIARVIRLKYFGDKKTSDIFEVRDVIPNKEVFDTITSDNAYHSFKNLFKQSDECLEIALKVANRFNKSLRMMYNSPSTVYTEIQGVILKFRGLLTALLYTNIAYWELYFSIRQNALAALRAIIRDDVEKQVSNK